MAHEIPCEGWWQQQGFGRQPMRDLRLRFDGGTISGAGRDIVGPFTLTGSLSDQGHVVMMKRYIGQHAVDYLGQYDGEGSLWGEWHIGPLKDRWMIRIGNTKSSAAHPREIEEIIDP
jgi:hypothetical protein